MLSEFRAYNIFGVNISTVFEEGADNSDVSSRGCEVQTSEIKL